MEVFWEVFWTRLVPMIICGIIAYKKNRNVFGWMVGGLFGSWITFAILIFLPTVYKTDNYGKEGWWKLLKFQKIAIWRFSKVWRNFCIPRRMAKDNALLKGLVALEKNHRKKAREIWEGLQRHFPKDYRVTHSLALLNYWETMSAGNPKGLNNEVIEKTIGNWVMLLNSDEFWESWRRERQPFYFQGNISKEQIEELRKNLRTQLENIVPHAYQNVLSLEFRTAELLCNIADWGKRKGLNYQLLIAGPIMLKQLGMLKKARRIALFGLQVEPQNNNFKLLREYLSPFGIVALLLREKRIEDALDEFSRIENKDQWLTKEFEEEFTNNIIEWANQSSNDEMKINKIERAINVFFNDTLRFIFCDECRSYAIKVVNEKGDWDKGIIYLEKALKVDKENLQIRKDLFTCYFYIISQLIEKEKPNEADKKIKSLKKFYNTLSPEEVDAEIRENIARLEEIVDALKKFGSIKILKLLTKAAEAMGNKNFNTAIEHLREALKLIQNRGKPEGEREIKERLAGCLNAQAVDRADTLLEKAENLVKAKNLDGLKNMLNELENEVLPKLKEASRLDPSNETINGNLQNLKEQVRQIERFINMGDEEYSGMDDLMRSLLSLKSLNCPYCRRGKLRLKPEGSGIKIVCQNCIFEVELK